MVDRSLDVVRGLADRGVPRDVFAVYGRWWQLETYLRELAYVELRADRGERWEEALGERAAHRAQADAVNAYMATADAGDVVTYLDTGKLFALINDNWSLFAPVLLPRRRWDGLVDALQGIRHRIAHLRRPHADDLARIEQALRDLESGAQRFYGAYTTNWWLPPKLKDPMKRAWVDGRHPTARRVLEHARDQYDVNFRLEYSVRPWTTVPKRRLSGTPGLLWHAHWTLGARDLDPRTFWLKLPPEPKRLLVHALMAFTGSLTVTFAAVDDPDTVSDAIGAIFDTVLMHSRRSDLSAGLDDNEYERWRSLGDELPTRMQLASALSLFDAHQPFAVFAA